MTTPADLQRVADWHAKCAAVARAKAEQAAHEGECDRFQACHRRAEGHLGYAEICESAAKQLAARAKRSAFIPPTLRELLAFARELGWPEDNARGWFDHFESNGWRVSGKSVMVDWKAGARNGFRRWKESNLKAPQSSANDDPTGWKEFLAANPEQKRECKRPEYRYAPERVQRAFLQSRRNTK